MNKWICIRSRSLFYKEGDIIILQKIDLEDCYFVLNEDRNPIDIISDTAVSEYFITLAEWREKQMKNIIDD
jgi:hypothetical protein